MQYQREMLILYVHYMRCVSHTTHTIIQGVTYYNAANVTQLKLSRELQLWMSSCSTALNVGKLGPVQAACGKDFVSW